MEDQIERGVTVRHSLNYHGAARLSTQWLACLLHHSGEGGIVDDIAALETASDGIARRDQLLRESVDELATMAELSTGNAFSTGTTWRQALDALRAHVERLITNPVIDAVILADIDLVLERPSVTSTPKAGRRRL
jgi:hypothetical protein